MVGTCRELGTPPSSFFVDGVRADTDVRERPLGVGGIYPPPLVWVKIYPHLR